MRGESQSQSGRRDRRSPVNERTLSRARDSIGRTKGSLLTSGEHRFSNW